jgi:hypothetical protein
MHPIRAVAEDRVFAIADGAVAATRRAVAGAGDRCAA